MITEKLMDQRDRVQRALGYLDYCRSKLRKAQDSADLADTGDADWDRRHISSLRDEVKKAGLDLQQAEADYVSMGGRLDEDL